MTCKMNEPFKMQLNDSPKWPNYMSEDFLKSLGIQQWSLQEFDSYSNEGSQFKQIMWYRAFIST